MGRRLSRFRAGCHQPLASGMPPPWDRLSSCHNRQPLWGCPSRGPDATLTLGMIGFLHPWVLAGLAAAAIPILLHLLARREPPTVVFPAVRYLVSTTREHQRRLKLQNWLLLFLRTLLVVLLVMAAAGPTASLRGVAVHAPSALVLIVDNSPSSGSMAGGSPQLAQLVAAARGVVARATPDEALWHIAADGVPPRGD